MSEIADQKEDEIIFEMNEEFSILKEDLTPMWFSFSDLHKKLKNQISPFTL